MKKLTLFFLILQFNILFGQSPLFDSNWILNAQLSDEFNNTTTVNWQDIVGGPFWGISYFEADNIGYGIEGSRSYLSLIADRYGTTYYTGGVRAGSDYGGVLGYGYGYYEIEAKIINTNNQLQNGLMPTFWFTNGQKLPLDGTLPPYWYEEVDIFEPNACQVENDDHVVGYFYNIEADDTFASLSSPAFPTGNFRKKEGVKNNVDMFIWHKYALEWLPNRLIFYFDDEPFFVIDNWSIPNSVPQLYNIPYAPTHQNTNVHIDLQITNPTECAITSSGDGELGRYNINYFRYYNMQCPSIPIVIDEIQGNSYNWSNYVYNLKQSCIFKNTSILNPQKINSIRFTDFVELKSDFEVSLGAELTILPSTCP